MAKKVSKKTKVSKKKAAKKKVAKKAAKKVAKKAAKKKVVKKKAAKKKAAKKKAVSKAVAKPVKKKKKPAVKSLSKSEVKYYQKILLDKRRELLGDMHSMSQEALSKNDSSELSNMPLHMADVGSDNYEQELTLGLVESERKMLNQIDSALQRIIDGNYGICEATDTPINKARLEAKPWARYCIEAAREMERSGQF